jgi:acyl dehydratase
MEGDTRVNTGTYHLSELQDIVGTELGPGPWFVMDQKRIDTFAEATDDFQWIHVDTERARQGPFGGTVAHGYLTLALVAPLLDGLVRVEGIAMGVNYGLDRVRFPSPVISGSRLRARVTLTSLEPVGPHALQAAFEMTMEVEGGVRPACVATVLCRYFRAPEDPV